MSTRIEMGAASVDARLIADVEDAHESPPDGFYVPRSLASETALGINEQIFHVVSNENHGADERAWVALRLAAFERYLVDAWERRDAIWLGLERPPKRLRLAESYDDSWTGSVDIAEAIAAAMARAEND